VVATNDSAPLSLTTEGLSHHRRVPGDEGQIATAVLSTVLAAE
jgi:hypothetical protein